MRTTILLFTTALLTTALLWKPGNKKTSPDPYQQRTIVYCSPSFDPVKMNDGNAPILEGFGHWNYSVTTRSEKAARYFNQGIALMYGFNHGEAGRSFKTAIRLDSTLAMAYWGLAMILGPNYNAALDPAILADINEALDKAVLYSRSAQPHERALIEALRERFPREKVEDMSPYYQAYAASMAKAHKTFPEDADIATLFADALMNQHPWDLWLKDGTAQPWTPEIVDLLEKTLAKYPDHPGAIHYYIHATEAGPDAGKATVYADKLASITPSSGHLVHMPSHTYIRTGEYHKGVLVTEAANEADSTYIAQCKVQGVYPLLYYPHNIHFLVACAFLEGNTKKAIDAAWTVSRKSDTNFLKTVPGVQHYYIIPYYILVHVGHWDEILSLAAPSDSLLYSKAIWHYARGMAFSAKGDQKKAGQELQAIRKISGAKELEEQRVWDINKLSDLVEIAASTLQGEIFAAKGKYDQAVSSLKDAVQREDQLSYNEPPDWFFSIRLTLGHWLVKAGRFGEAEKVYLDDLATFPENGWALKGLYNSLIGQNKTQEAEAVKKRFDKAWQWGDVSLTSSRIY